MRSNLRVHTMTLLVPDRSRTATDRRRIRVLPGARHRYRSATSRKLARLPRTRTLSRGRVPSWTGSPAPATFPEYSARYPEAARIRATAGRAEACAVALAAPAQSPFVSALRLSVWVSVVIHRGLGRLVRPRLSELAFSTAAARPSGRGYESAEPSLRLQRCAPRNRGIRGV